MGLPVAIMHVGSLYAVAAGAGCVLLATADALGAPLLVAAIAGIAVTTVIRILAVVFDLSLPEQRMLPRRKVAAETRSDEHTSELQSLMRISYAVFCLKKNTSIKSTSS